MQRLRSIMVFSVAILWLATPIVAQQQKQGISQAPAASRHSESDQGKAGLMTLKLREGLELKGNTVEMDNVKMTSLIGEVDVPINTIAGIRFAQQPGEQTTLVLLNGDAITGDLALTDVKFVSNWGEAKVNIGHLESIVFRPDFAWSEVGTPNGKRWRLTKIEKQANQNNYIHYNGARVYSTRPR